VADCADRETRKGKTSAKPAHNETARELAACADELSRGTDAVSSRRNAAAARAMRVTAYPAVIMFLNGVGHLAGSIYLGRWAPGATTAPLLLLSSTWLLYSVRQLANRES